MTSEKEDNNMLWQQELKSSVRSVKELVALGYVPPWEQERLNAVEQNFPICVPRYYLSLIDKGREDDPIRKMCIPALAEEDASGAFDTSGELSNTVERGLQHKYKNTALILSTNVCAMYCRHCFRKRMVGVSDAETAAFLTQVLSYVREHEEIDNILVSGGDSFLLSNRVIEKMLSQIAELQHIRFVRFGTRVPVVLPSRLEDKALLSTLSRHAAKTPIYAVTQFNHPNEITAASERAVKRLRACGVVVSNQTVLLKGVNDDENVLAELMNGLTSMGVVPYYVFQCRPVRAVKGQFQVPLSTGLRLVEHAKAMLNGHAKRFKYVMSHETGKIEILGAADDGRLLFKYHQPKYEKDAGRMFAADVSGGRAWLDEAPGGLLY
ncbi:MAG: KamA family radical SAM protein [Eubacteriales bacterium]|nr:KamA family radical SAM protein [Eubacteriales bacterium]